MLHCFDVKNNVALFDKNMVSFTINLLSIDISRASSRIQLSWFWDEYVVHSVKLAEFYSYYLLFAISVNSSESEILYFSHCVG